MKKTIELFKRAFQKNKLSHLYLLSGEKGCPLLETAINCCVGVLSNFSDDGTIYKKVSHHNHLDVYILDKGSDRILKEDIYELQEEFSKTSTLAGYRCFIINNIDNITIQAANSMLKFLEEPSLDRVLGILLTNNKDFVLPTIISRVQSIIISGVSLLDFTSDALKLGSFNKKEIFYISLFTKDIGFVKTVINDGDFKVFLGQFNSFITSYIYLKKDFLTTSFFDISSITKHKNLIRYFYESVFNYFLLILKNDFPQELKEVSDNIKKLRDLYSREQLLYIVKTCSDILKKTSYNVNLELQFLNFLISIDKVIKYDYM